MIKGLQAGFGTSIAADLRTLYGIGVQLARLDCMGQGPDKTAALAAEPTAEGIIPFVIVDNVEQLSALPSGTNIELLNEPDLNGPIAIDYEKLVYRFAAEAQRRGLYLWAGAISNMNARGFTYLRDAHVGDWPIGVNVSVHRYPNGDTPWAPHDGFTSRDHEVLMLKVLIGKRTWGCSEFGYHTANRASWWQRLFGIKKQWTDKQVMEFVAWEWRFWEYHGALGAALYQLNDGPSKAAGDHFGIRYLGGGWKPVASTFRG